MKYILFILILLPLVAFSQIPDGTYKMATVTFTGNLISAIDSALGYNSGTGVLSIVNANTSQGGILSSTDWNTFNNKQSNLISGTNIKSLNGNSLLGSGNLSLALGESNTALNIGSGLGLFKQKTGVDLEFKSILGTNNQINVTANTNDITISLASRVMSTATRSLVTTTSSTGFQISANRDYSVNYSIYAQVTSVLIGTNTADIYLEIAATNSTTPADWTTVSRSGISVSGVVSTSGNTQTVGGFIPAGFYVRLRIVATGSNSGSAVFTYQVGQENTY